jgi:hypothetical protein
MISIIYLIYSNIRIRQPRREERQISVKFGLFYRAALQPNSLGVGALALQHTSFLEYRNYSSYAKHAPEFLVSLINAIYVDRSRNPCM